MQRCSECPEGPHRDAGGAVADGEQELNLAVRQNAVGVHQDGTGCGTGRLARVGAGGVGIGVSGEGRGRGGGRRTLRR